MQFICNSFYCAGVCFSSHILSIKLGFNQVDLGAIAIATNATHANCVTSIKTHTLIPLHHFFPSSYQDTHQVMA